jgi:hypothetical protein
LTLKFPPLTDSLADHAGRHDDRFQDVTALEDDAGFAVALFQFLQFLHAHRNTDKADIEALAVPMMKGISGNKTKL